VLAREGAQLGRDYAARRRENPRFRFQWRRSLLEVVREALAVMTAWHCSYCDGHPLRTTGVEAVDHFRPKSHPDFHDLVCTWENLFLTCTACNQAKREQWDDALLRPDDPEFRFGHYFEYRFDSGKLEPASAASAAEQQRAIRTIEIFDLNRADACASRQRVVRWMRSADAADEPDDGWAYRYLLPLCRVG
jgi:uncharacterized protein (TIGR02646 family)